MTDAELSKALEVEAEREQLRIEVGRLTALLSAAGKCASCGAPLNRDCPSCQKAWES